jgi:hypothetical protein
VADIPAIIKTTLSLSANGYKKTGGLCKVFTDDIL